MATGGERLRFGRGRRLTRAREFSAAYGARLRKSAGPLTVFGRANGLGRSRLGLSVGRRVGGAVARNRIKRLVREAFRLEQRELPAGYDFVVQVRPHVPLGLGEYRAHLTAAARGVEREAARRARREERDAAG